MEKKLIKLKTQNVLHLGFSQNQNFVDYNVILNDNEMMHSGLPISNQLSASSHFDTCTNNSVYVCSCTFLCPAVGLTLSN